MKLYMELSKRQTIEEHRKLWNWIADKYKAGSEKSAACLKSEYLNEHGYKNLYHTNFLCNYARQKSKEDMCLFCPVRWSSYVYDMPCINDEYANDNFGLYGRLLKETSPYEPGGVDTEECERLAREIAELPERR